MELRAACGRTRELSSCSDQPRLVRRQTEGASRDAHDDEQPLERQQRRAVGAARIMRQRRLGIRLAERPLLLPPAAGRGTAAGCCPTPIASPRSRRTSACIYVVCHISSDAACGRNRSQYSAGDRMSGADTTPRRCSAHGPAAAICNGRRRSGVSCIAGICTASTPPGARNDSRRGNSIACRSTHCSAAFE